MATVASVLKAVKIAVKTGAWRPDPHLFKQLAKRGLTLIDVLAALGSARRAVPHDMLPLNPGGESWRVYGNDTENGGLGSVLS